MDVWKAMAERQGTLSYLPQPVGRDAALRVLAAAAQAPSPANLQPWEFVVLDHPELVRQVGSYLIDVQQRLVFGGLLGMSEERERWMHLYDGFENVPCFVFVCLRPLEDDFLPEHRAVLRDWCIASAGAALQNMMLAATALGLGTRWFGGFALEHDRGTLQSWLQVPAGVEIVAATPLGYHDSPQKPRPEQDPAAVREFRRGDAGALKRLLRGRVPLARLVHWNGW